jgi:hypothetical protein
VLSANPKNSNAVLSDGNQIKTYISQSSLQDYDYWPKDNSNSNFTNINSPDTLKNANKASNKKTSLDILGKKLANAVVSEVNRQITTQARLLNNTLDNIRNSIGLGRMSAPTNVYHGNSPFKNDVVNAARDFVGQSVKSFFTPPNENQ